MPSFNTTFQTPDLVATAGTVGDSKTGTIRLPSGTTAQRPAVATAGMVRFNSTSGFMETYTGSAWVTAGYGVAQSFSGLQLRTSPNADVAATTVSVLGLTQWVANDGTPVTDTLTNNTALITNSGAGGLDTGSEAASTWYEIYRIRKSSDGTLNTLLHRAKDYFLDESQLTQDSDNTLRRATTSRSKIAQTFDTDVTGLMEFVDLKIIKQVSPTGQLWVSLYATSAGVPTGSALYTSDLIDVSLISTTMQWIRFVFRTPPTLTASTTYAISVEANYTLSDTNNVAIGLSTAGGYAAGAQYSYDGASWATVGSQDLTFKVYVTENDTAVTMPSGYNQQCLLGYVRNNGSSNFNAFAAYGKRVMPLSAYGSLGAVTAAVPTLIDASAFIPPRPVALWLNYNNSSATQLGYLAGVPDGFLPQSATTRPGGQMFVYAQAGSGMYPVEYFTDYQGTYFSVAGGTGDTYLAMWEWF